MLIDGFQKHFLKKYSEGLSQGVNVLQLAWMIRCLFLLLVFVVVVFCVSFVYVFYFFLYFVFAAIFCFSTSSICFVLLHAFVPAQCVVCNCLCRPALLSTIPPQHRQPACSMLQLAWTIRCLFLLLVFLAVSYTHLTLPTICSV